MLSLPEKTKKMGWTYKSHIRVINITNKIKTKTVVAPKYFSSSFFFLKQAFYVQK